MKRSIVSVITALSVLLTVMTMASCDLLSPKEDEPTKQPDSPYGPETPDGPAYGPETPDGPALYEKALWGEWVRMDTGEKWYISSSFIKVDAYELFQMPVLNKQSDKVIEVSDSGRKYYLYASRVANTSFTGKIASFDAPSSRSLGGIGGIGISITNLNNMANEVSATTDTNGNFTVEGIIPGDAYTITPEGGTPTTVMPQGDGDDVGTITIVSGGVNFKTTINSSATYRAGTSNSISITVTNTGDEDCTAATFELAFGDGLSGTTSGILGTIEPGKTRTIQVNVSCGAIEAESEFKKIGVKITDTAINKTWDDSVSVKFYKETVDFNIRANSGSSVSGVLIAPQGVYPFKNISWGQPITVPRSTEDYLLVFSGATAETETIYSFGIDVPAIESFAGFMDLMNYEPNNTEETATPVTQFQIVSYVHKNDIDYYRINLDYPPNIPTDLTVTEISNTSVALSWPAVLGATSYKVYRGSSASNGTVIASVSETAGSYYNYDTGAYDAYAYTDTGLSPNTTYHYRVTAVYNNNESDQSVYTTATTSNVVPEVTKVSNTSITLSWPAGIGLGATSYKVYRGSSASNGAAIASVPKTDSYYNYDTGAYAYTYTDTGLSPNTTYYYRIAAVYDSNESPQSEYTTATTSNVVPEVTKVSNTSITLSWPAGIGLGATSYKVYRGSSASNGAAIASVPKTDSYNYDSYTYTYTNTGLSPNTTYYYRIAAVYDSNESPQSEYTTATTSNVVPEVTKVSNTSITLSWPAGIGLGATSYKVYRGSSASNGAAIASVSEAADSYYNYDTGAYDAYAYTDTGLSPNTTYYYRIAAVYDSNESDQSEYATATTSNWVALDSPFGFEFSISAIAYGDGKFVAGDDNFYGKIAYSSDGINWTAAVNSPLLYIQTITYSDGKFVAGYHGGVAYSSDGINWTAATDIQVYIQAIAYGGGKFVAGGYNGQIAYSGDGISWTLADTPFGSSSRINAIAYGDGKFVAGGDGQMAYSSDGINWTAVADTSFGSSRINAIAYGGGKFVAGGDGQIAYSSDGISWTLADTPFGSSFSISAIAYGDGKFVARDSSGQMAYSSDGISWSAAVETPLSSIYAIAHGKGKFVAFGDGNFVAGSYEKKMAYWED